MRFPDISSFLTFTKLHGESLIILQTFIKTQVWALALNMQQSLINDLGALIWVLPSWMHLYLAPFITATIFIILAPFSAFDP